MSAQLDLLRPIDHLTEMDADPDRKVSGRVIHVQSNDLVGRKRVRVIDDFTKSYQTTCAEVIATDNAVQAVVFALQIQFGATRVIENGRWGNDRGHYTYTRLEP